VQAKRFYPDKGTRSYKGTLKRSRGAVKPWQDIQEAAEKGDLKENAEYHAAKENSKRSKRASTIWSKSSGRPGCWRRSAAPKRAWSASAAR